jgi:uncharacterized protein (DUF58 family)
MNSTDRTYELLRKVRKIEIKTKGLSSQLFAGSYHSAFKGKGMSFSEVRAYQYGDDVRNIDWNVSARMDETFVKVFEEERELTVMLLADISGSTFFGATRSRDGSALFKQELMAEIAAVLAFSAISNNDKVGALLFSDQIERFIPPRKGRNHTLRIIRELVGAEPQGRGTDLAGALRHLTNMLKKRSIVFLLSDFMGAAAPWRDDLLIARRRHDVIGIHLYDPREQELPPVGLLRVEDPETGQTAWLDSNSRSARAAYAEHRRLHFDRTRETFLRCGADFLSLSVEDAYVQALMGLFARRGR